MPTRLVYVPARHQLDYLAEHVRHILHDRGRSLLLVTANQSARRLWDYFRGVGIRTERLYVLDVVSSPLIEVAGNEAHHLTYLGNPTALETITIRAERIARRMPEPVHVVLHNINAMCLYNSAEVLEEAIRRVVHDVADPRVLIDFVIEEEGGVYRDLDRFLVNFVDYKKALGPRVVSGEKRKHEEEKPR